MSLRGGLPTRQSQRQYDAPKVFAIATSQETASRNDDNKSFKTNSTASQKPLRT
ncbi:MAG: hypothetical protein V4642_04790 [Bacteroidota bacterium]